MWFVSAKKLSSAPHVLASISRGFAHGLAQMSSGGLAGPMTSWPKRPKSAAEALGEDWQRLGRDMNLALQKVRERSVGE